MDLPYRLEYLYQLHTERRKEHSGDCNPHTGSRPQRRGRRDTSHVTATLPDDKPAGATEKSIILLYLEEKSYEEISEITGLTVTNVATKLNRIKDKLKKMNKEE